MELESFGFSKERAREMVNIMCSLKTLLKNPKAAVKDNISITTALLVLLSLILIGLIIVGAFTGSIIVNMCSGFYLAIVILYIPRLINMHKSVKALMNLSKDRKTVLETEGILLKVNGISDTKFYWSAFSIVRVFKYNVFFVPKDNTIQGLSLPIEDLDVVKQYMRDNNVDLEFCE